MSQEVTQNRPAHVVIDTSAYRHNLQRVRDWAPSAKVMAVIKADGYGHGMETAADALSDADEFGVNSLDDVARLRKSGVDKPLSLLSARLSLAELNNLRNINVRPMCYDAQQLPLFEQLDPAAKLSIWLKVDTGMGRLGFAPHEVAAVLERLQKCQGVADISLMTHLGNADQAEHVSNAEQISVFNSLVQTYQFADLSVLNSAGVVSFADAAYSQVRPGLVLYGMSPTQGKSSQQLGLRPVMSFISELISIKTLPKGHAVGYGSTHSLARDTQVGIIAVGYGDGYPRHAPHGTPVVINGQRVPLIGRVSMDMIVVDLSQISASLGDQALLWGLDNPIEEVAAAADTIAYELTCGILPRVQRITI